MLKIAEKDYKSEKTGLFLLPNLVDTSQRSKLFAHHHIALLQYMGINASLILALTQS
ncbi:hypothetical protein ACK8P5_11085 [Paenibacillus sp. EC2-1]|uniref:hypothetical protein n=1 Tax=Paenibacillus sp. EC2-1 TaxID=3388665 RepID=UPI003BEF1774